MTREEAFLNAIRDEPDDDGLRLIYADWLEEQGQPERAEFIRVQIELAHHLDPDRPDERTLTARDLAGRLQALLTPHQAAWTALLAGLGKPRFERGLPEHVQLSGRGFVTHAAELFQRVPSLHRLRLHGSARAMTEIAALPELRFLTGLDLHNNSIGSARLGVLLASPHLTRLPSLFLSHNRLYLADVQTLDLRGNRLAETAKTRLRESFGSRVLL